jgi:hypothetical protein
MNQEQIDVLNVTQQALRGVVLGLLAMQPGRAAEVSEALQAAASQRGIEPMAQRMLADLAEGVGALAAASVPRQ